MLARCPTRAGGGGRLIVTRGDQEVTPRYFSRSLHSRSTWSQVIITLRSALRRRKLHCPKCDFATRARYDRRPVESVWCHLDLGVWRLQVRAQLRRLNCPDHGVRTEGVPFARAGSRHITDLEDLVGYLATQMDKTAICRLARVNWDTVGRMITRVMETGLDPTRLDNLFEIGVDEVGWRKASST